MPRVALHVLGQERLVRAGRTAVEVPDLFWSLVGCLLAARRQSLSRTRLALKLWPDKEEEAARHCLASALWRFRGRLGPAADLLVAEGNLVTLAGGAALWIDALALERRARPMVERPRLLADRALRHRLARTLHRHSGEFLTEVDLEDVAIERARLRALWLDALYELCRAQAEAGEWPAAVRSARELCAAEPLREDAQRILIEAYAQSGNRGLALRQFRRCEEVLARELDVRPMAETRALHARLLRQGTAEAGAARAGGHRAALIEARRSLVLALALIERSLDAP